MKLEYWNLAEQAMEQFKSNELLIYFSSHSRSAYGSTISVVFKQYSLQFYFSAAKNKLKCKEQEFPSDIDVQLTFNEAEEIFVPIIELWLEQQNAT